MLSPSLYCPRLVYEISRDTETVSAQRCCSASPFSASSDTKTNSSCSEYRLDENCGSFTRWLWPMSLVFLTNSRRLQRLRRQTSITRKSFPWIVSRYPRFGFPARRTGQCTQDGHNITLAGLFILSYSQMYHNVSSSFRSSICVQNHACLVVRQLHALPLTPSSSG